MPCVVSCVDRTVTGYEGLIAAQQCLPDNATRDRFAADYSYLARLWEALSPDPSLESYEADYRWLSQVYESVKPSTGTGRLLWHTLGAKTIDLIHRHVHVDTVRDDLETLVLDAEVLDAVLGTPDPDKKSKEIEIKVANRLRKHLHDPRFPPSASGLKSCGRSTSRACWSASSSSSHCLISPATWSTRSEPLSPRHPRNAARRR